MNNGNICVSVFAATADELSLKVREAEPHADIIEVRFDYLNPIEIDKFIENIPGTERQFLFTFRPQTHGGNRDIGIEERRAFWNRIHSKLINIHYLVDYESDLEMLADFDPQRVIVSSHDFTSNAFDPALVRDLFIFDAATIKIAKHTDTITDTIPVWSLLRSDRMPGQRIVPIAMGEAGKWTRILGLAHNSPITYASLGTGNETASGQLSAQDMSEVYRVKTLDADTDVYGIIAGDTSYSMSPYIHNSAFKAAKLNSVFIPLQVNDLDSFMKRMVTIGRRELELNFKGFSVTNPYKETIGGYLYETNAEATAIGAVNTVSIVDNRLYGHNTDAEGFILPLLRRFGDLRDSRSAVIGSGGAARACTYALQAKGSNVTMFSRDVRKAAATAYEMNVAAETLPATFAGFDIVVNATPLGTRGSLEHETVATAGQLFGTNFVYDLIYNPAETRLAAEASAAGIEFIGGLEMLITQAAAQFKIWTGTDASIDQMRAAVEQKLASY